MQEMWEHLSMPMGPQCIMKFLLVGKTPKMTVRDGFLLTEVAEIDPTRMAEAKIPMDKICKNQFGVQTMRNWEVEDSLVVTVLRKAKKVMALNCTHLKRPNL